MKFPLARLLLPLLGVVLLSACSRTPSWLAGSWQFDADRTQKEMSEAVNGNAGSPPNMFSGLSNMVGAMLVPELAGTQLIITDKEFMTLRDGQGKSLGYEVVAKSSDTCTLKFNDGTVETYYRAGAEIFSYPTGSAHFKIYFRRQS
jgi:hypothetical protein